MRALNVVRAKKVVSVLKVKSAVSVVEKR